MRFYGNLFGCYTDVQFSLSVEIFAARGFAEASLQDAAQRAGVTRGAVYHQYQNKLGLFRAVVARFPGYDYHPRDSADFID